MTDKYVGQLGRLADKEMNPPTTEERIKKLFYGGNSPSEIDKKLRLSAGYAHDIIIGIWYDEKCRKNKRYD